MADATVDFRPPGPAGPPLRLTGQDGDHGVLRAVERAGGAYEPGLLAVLQRRLAPDAVALDVGANIGPVALAMGRFVPAGRVFAFEPAPSNFAYLVRNLADNAAANVAPERVALYDRDGPLSFTVSDDDPAGSHVPGGTEVPTTTVEGMTLDRFVAERGLDRLDLVKLDVEGAELRVLRGAAATLARFRPDLVFEVNPVALRRFHRASFRDLLALVRTTHPAVFSFDGSGRRAAVLSDDHLARLLSRHGVVNLLATGRPARRERMVPALLSAVAAPVRGITGLAVLAAGRRPPAAQFAVEPAVTLTVPAGAVEGPAGGRITVPLDIANHGRQWLSSGWTYHPVHAGYRWLDPDGVTTDDDGVRTVLPAPVPPGGSAAVALAVDLPTEPGRYQLAVTLVQESYAWFDDIDAGLRTVVPVEVHSAS